MKAVVSFFLTLSLLLPQGPACAAEAGNGEGALVPAGWDAALAGDVVMQRLINTSAPRVKGAHDAEFVCVGDKAYIVTEANDVKPGESAGWPFIYVTMSIVNLGTLKLERVIDFARGEQTFENETLPVGACFVPRILQKDADTLRCYFTSEDPGKRQSQMWHLDFDLKSGAFAKSIHKTKIKTVAGTFDMQPQYFYADAAAQGFRRPAKDAGLFIFDSFKTFGGKTYVALNNFPAGQNALALVHEDLETFEVLGHYNEPQSAQLSESAVNRLPDGTWMAICCNDRGNYHFTTSADGRSWSTGQEMPFVPNGANSKPTFDKFGGVYYLGWQEATQIHGVRRSVFNIDVSRDGKTWQRKYRFETPESFQYPTLHEHEGVLWLAVTQGPQKARIMFGRLEDRGAFESQAGKTRTPLPPAPPKEAALTQPEVQRPAAITRAEAMDGIPLRDLPLLFADDSGVAASSGVVRTMHPARTRPQPVLEGSLPQEGSRVYLAGSVYRDEATGLLRMWYAGHPDLPDGKKPKVEGLRTGKGNFVLYATSKDGLAWDRPPLGLFSFQGSKDNNIIHDFHSPSVLLDPADPDPARRYKMLGSITGAYYSATSPDGQHWSGPKQPIVKSSDNITLTQHPLTGEYLAFLRVPAKVRGYPRRTVSLSRSRDFITWSKPELVFAPDEQDDAWATVPGQRTEVNNMAVFPHAAGLLGFPTLFRVTATDRPAAGLTHGQSPTDGTLDVQLITSADGAKWQRMAKREPIIARGAAGGFDGGSIFSVGSTVVHAGDETWVYYTGISTTHGAPMPPKRIAIGRAEWRRHGFVSLDAEDTVARVETRPLRLATPWLVVNADASRGELRAALLESDGRAIPGFALAESTVLKTDDTRWMPQWHHAPAPPTDRPVRVVLEMKKTRLFSLACEAAKAH